MSESPKLARFNSRTSMYPLRYDRSKIHRIGVFAVGPIPRGKKVIEYTGERLTRAQALRRFQRIWVPNGKRPIYLLTLNRRWVLDGAFHGSGAERINHSCDPNLKPKRTRGRIFFVSKRRIEAGEELTLDYDIDPGAPTIRCRCGAGSCRGTINRKKQSTTTQAIQRRR